MFRVLVLGGYGNFGSFISCSLAKEPNIQVIVAGRSIEKAQALVASLEAKNSPQAVALDIQEDFENELKTISPNLVIHTSGPFQAQSYDVAEACIENHIHYIDLADGRNFVEGITSLDERAERQGIAVISGASSVPCLTSALVDNYRAQFDVLEHLDYGITTAQKTARGLATTAAILGYTGKPFDTLIDGQQKTIYGWQGLRLHRYKYLGRRFLGNCDIPDLSLFPERYPELKTVRFSAGLEIPFIHLSLWALSGLVRAGLISRLEKAAAMMLRMSFWFDWLGSDKSAFHMELRGKGKDDLEKSILFELTAGSGDGPYIPCMPSILLAKRFAKGDIQSGAYPCMGLVSKGEYLNVLGEMDISWEETDIS